MITDCLFHQVRGWVTAVQKGGKERLARQHAKVDANERRLQLELWNKRLAADKAFEKALKANSGAGVHLDESVVPYKAAGALGVNNHSGVATSSLASQLLSGLTPSAVELAERLVGPSFSYEPQHASAHHGASASSPQVGPSFSYELAADARGIAFAFGGIFPGRLHAHGELVKVHQVSIFPGRLHADCHSDYLPWEVACTRRACQSSSGELLHRGGRDCMRMTSHIR
jgi:hypothetical protein